MQTFSKEDDLIRRAKDDPDAFGSERLVLNNCWFGDLTLMSFENAKVLEEEYSGGFTDFDFPDLVRVR